MGEAEFLVDAFALDGSGGGREIDVSGLNSWKPSDGPLWAHFDFSQGEAARWINEESGLDEVVREALLDRETRPRYFVHDGGLLVILRGVNLNPGADPEEMISIRMWVEPGRVLSMRRKKLMAVRDMVDSIREGKGPKTTGAFLADISRRLVVRMNPVIGELDDKLDEMEAAMLDGGADGVREKLATLRREIIRLRRYLAPQRETLMQLYREKTDVLSQDDREELREAYDKLTRYVEDMDALRERAALIQEQLAARLADALNRNTYLLSVVAGLFLPLGFITGLLGVNVGGIPGVENPWAFYAVTAMTVVIVVAEVWLLKKLKWI